MLNLITIFISFTACSNDDEKDHHTNDPNNSSNEISFDVSGAVEGEKIGSCYITIVGGTSYSISSNDKTSSADQTFSLSFYKSFESNSTAHPAPGTYPIGTVADVMNEDRFWLVYTDTQNDREFGSETNDISGTLTITSNSNHQLKGTFEFTATNQETGDSIQVNNGTFSAAID